MDLVPRSLDVRLRGQMLGSHDHTGVGVLEVLGLSQLPFLKHLVPMLLLLLALLLKVHTDSGTVLDRLYRMHRVRLALVLHL